MNLCFSTLACPAWDLGRIVEAAAASGITGIDFRGLGDQIDVTRLPAFNQEWPATAELLRRNGLSVPCLNTSISLIVPAPERWQMMLEECDRYAHLARNSGTRYLRIFAGAIPKGMSQAESLQLAHRHARQLLKLCAGAAEGAGCQLLVETHDEWTSTATVLKLVGEFSPEQLGVLWDIEHTHFAGETPANTWAGMGRYIRHCHIKDCQRIDTKHWPRLLGAGELPLRPFLSVLKDSGYTGWVCLETEKRWVPEAPDPEQSLPQFAAYVREALAQP